MPPKLTTPPPVTPDGPAVRVPIAGYTLAVSWSPEFCRGAALADPDNSGQCATGKTRFGFILHGLWPEGAGRESPQWCGTGRAPSLDTLRASFCMTPSARLQAHEWAKHGACMARTPEGYAKVARVLWQGLRWPDADRLSRQPALTAGELRQAIAAANPGWRSAAIGLLVGERGWLRELRLCYGKDFMPAACPRERFGPRDSQPLKIWRGL